MSCFFRSLTCPGLESLGHRVDTVTGENKMWVLSSLVVYFFPSVACRVLVTEWLPLNVRTKYGDCQVLQVLHRTSVLLLCTPWLRSLYHFLNYRYRWEQSMGSVESCVAFLFFSYLFRVYESWSSSDYCYRWEHSLCSVESCKSFVEDHVLFAVY